MPNDKLFKVWIIVAIAINIALAAWNISFNTVGNYIVASVPILCALFMAFWYPTPKLNALWDSAPSHVNKRNKLRWCIMMTVFGTEAQKMRWHYHCIDCGSMMKWSAIIKRNWSFTACESCESYCHFMEAANKQR